MLPAEPVPSNHENNPGRRDNLDYKDINQGCARSGSAGKASRIRTPLAIRPASRTPVGRLRDRRRRPHVATHIPIATGERIFTKWAFKEILEKRAAAILQPDVCYAGGITELKIIGGMLLTGPNLGITIDEDKLEAEVG